METAAARPKPRRKFFSAAYIAASLGVLGALFFINPTRTALLPCVFRQATGLDCPGCGMTRAMYFLFHLDFARAFRYHPFCFAAPMLGIVWLQGLLALARGRGLRLPRGAVLGAVAAVAALMVLFDVGRDIPGWALSYFKV